MTDFNSPPGKYNITERLFFLIDDLSPDRQFLLYKQLIKDKVTTQLFKLIIDMSAEEKIRFLEKFGDVQYEEEHVKTINLDENDAFMRKNPRKACLIEVKCRVAEHSFNGYIINLSTDGVFIETKNRIGVGQKIAMAFSLPNHTNPLKITGEIARNEPHGISVILSALNQDQLKVIRNYIENN